MSHAKRAKGHGAALVTIKLKPGLPSLRTPRAGRLIEEVLHAANDRLGMRICHYGVISNHMHLLVDADNEQSLSRAMQGFNIRLAKAINKLWHRRGKVFRDRFHAKWAKGVNSIRRAARYVMQNARRHGLHVPAGQPDRYSSGLWYPWLEDDICPPDRPSPVVPPRELSWMWAALRSAWRISIHSLPRDPMPWTLVPARPAHSVRSGR